MKKNILLFERIKEVRLDEGLNKAEFGERLGVCADYVRMLEKGTRHPSEGLLLAMCYRFNVNEGWLKSGTKGKENGSRPRVVQFAG